MSLPTACIKRIARDVSDINKNSLANNGIFYVHDEENILNGYALIIGPDIPFMKKFFFSFYFQFSPPKVHLTMIIKQHTFSSNLVEMEKRALLNTWKGDGWTSCQNIRSVLLTLSSILTPNPLIEEPGITISHKDNIPYNNIITFKNIEVSIIKIMEDCNNNKLNDFSVFSYIIQDIFKKNKELIKDKILKLKETNISSIKRASVYNMECEINYKVLLDKFEKLI